MDRVPGLLEQFWDDLILIKEACVITQLNNHAVVWRVQKKAIRGKRIGGLWVVSRASAEYYARMQEPLRETNVALEQFWDDLIPIKEACVITQLSDDAMLLRLHKQEILGRLVGMLWVVSRASSVENANTHEDQPKHKPGAKPGSEEAKRGGQAILERYGREFYHHLGPLGGEAMRQKYGHDYYTRIGLLGGVATKEKYGPDHYHQIGKMNKGRRKRKGTADGE